MAVQDSGILDRERPPKRNVTLTVEQSSRRRAAVDPLTDYNIDVTYTNCTQGQSQAPVAVSATLRSGMVTALNVVCDMVYTDASLYLLKNTQLNRYECPPNRFISEWIVYSPFMDPFEVAESGLGVRELSIQPICSDNTSLPIIGDNRPYLRVMGRVGNLDGKELSLVAEQDRGNGSNVVVTESMGVRNPLYANTVAADARRSFSCYGQYGHIWGIDALVDRDTAGDYMALRDLKVCTLTSQWSCPIYIYIYAGA